MNELIKKTGNYWGSILGISIESPKGWKSEEDFKSLYITKEEFLERAANSNIKFDKNISRRDAAKMLKKLSNYQ